MEAPIMERDAELIYGYHRILDTRVARRAAQFFLDGYAAQLIFFGGSGKLTAGRFRKPEAKIFADVAMSMGVPIKSIIVHAESTKTGENVRFMKALLQRRGVRAESFILVQKPYMERLAWATFRKQPGEPEPEFSVPSPQVDFSEYPDEANPRDWVVHIMVGDLVRIREYPALGFQVPQDMPENVWEAGQRLVAAGYDKHLPS